MLNKDEWLSQYFSPGAYTLSFPYEIQKLPDLPTGFIYSKVPAEDNKTVNQLLACGFQLIEVAVQFIQKQAVLFKKNADLEFGFAKAIDQNEIGKLGETAFIYSRFHQDPHISRDTANQIKKDWVLNFFKGKRGDNMVTAYFNKQPVGFIQLVKHTIDLIAVSKYHRGKGIASSMIAFANEYIGLLQAGTQIINNPSVSLYQSAKFTLQKATFILHKHKSDYATV